MASDPSGTRAARHSQVLARLAEGISGLTASGSWQRYLDCQSRFHRYSFSNVVLIAAQYPSATQVAGFAAWKKLGRTVCRGEKAIWILAPMVGRRDEDEGEGQRVVRGFRQVGVFDVSQTEGEPLPEVCRRLDGDVGAGYLEPLVALAGSIGFSVQLCQLGGGVNGDCSFEHRRIRVEAGNAANQRVKTLAHELAHALLHTDQDDRRLAELEAESTAYVVCTALGIDSADYSLGYVAIWSGGGEAALAGIRASGERIQKTAARILDGCERVADTKSYGPSAGVSLASAVA